MFSMAPTRAPLAVALSGSLARYTSLIATGSSALAIAHLSLARKLPAIAVPPEHTIGIGPAKLRIPLILISHSGRSRSPIPVILIMLLTMPEEGTADSMTWRWTATTDG